MMISLGLPLMGINGLGERGMFRAQTMASAGGAVEA